MAAYKALLRGVVQTSGHIKVRLKHVNASDRFYYIRLKLEFPLLSQVQKAFNNLELIGICLIDIDRKYIFVEIRRHCLHKNKII